MDIIIHHLDAFNGWCITGNCLNRSSWIFWYETYQRMAPKDGYFASDSGLDLPVETETSSGGGLLDLENNQLAPTYLHLQIQVCFLSTVSHPTY